MTRNAFIQWASKGSARVLDLKGSRFSPLATAWTEVLRY